MPDKEKRAPPRRKERLIPEAFPDYAKSMTSQMQSSPLAAAAVSGAGTGAASSALAALAAKVMGADDGGTALAALAALVLGGGVGAYSGYHDRDSANSRLRYLGRMGVESPGELEVMSRYPEIAAQLASADASSRRIKELEKMSAARMEKKASPATMALGALAGGAAGGAWGRYGAPEVFGYGDNPSSVNMGTLLNAAEGAALGANPAMWAREVAENPKMLALLAGSVSLAELLPVAHNMIGKTTKTMANLDKPTISQQAESLLSTPEAKGAVGGSALAALLSLATGSLRARTEDEAAARSSRGRMMLNDFLSYAAPAALAGGVTGNILKGNT
jgi:hypothetical protein